MTKPTDFEIPAPLREIAAENLVHARATYGQWEQLARAARAGLTAKQCNLAADLLDVQAQAVTFAEQNVIRGIDTAERLAKAQDLLTILEIQSEYANRQFAQLQEQAGELREMLVESVKNLSATKP